MANVFPTKSWKKYHTQKLLY